MRKVKNMNSKDMKVVFKILKKMEKKYKKENKYFETTEIPHLMKIIEKEDRIFCIGAFVLKESNPELAKWFLIEIIDEENFYIKYFYGYKKLIKDTVAREIK